MEAEGIEFRYNLKASPSPSQGEGVEIHSDPDVSASSCNQTSPPWEGLGEAFSAVIIATGTPTARDLKIPGRELSGVHFALELLSQQNRVLAGMEFNKNERITAKGKDVLVIGGGDTGSDCIGTAHRQGCKSVTQIEIMPKPVEGPEDPQNPWPNFPRTLKTTSSHEEGCTRRWNINTLEFIGENGKLKGVKVQEIDWKPNPDGGRPIMVVKGEPEIIKAELCLLAMGFLKPEHPEYPSNVFVCGDAKNGASLVVRAMASGIETARKVNDYLSKM
jgi:glutamate synthase (NADPH/NADH) small chain